jgi:hypothetical protein
MGTVQIGLVLHLGIWRCGRELAGVGLLKKEKSVKNGSQMYKHNAESSEEMWKEVGARTRVSG